MYINNFMKHVDKILNRLLILVLAFSMLIPVELFSVFNLGELRKENTANADVEYGGTITMGNSGSLASGGGSFNKSGGMSPSYQVGWIVSIHRESIYYNQDDNGDTSKAKDRIYDYYGTAYPYTNSGTIILNNSTNKNVSMLYYRAGDLAEIGEDRTVTILNLKDNVASSPANNGEVVYDILKEKLKLRNSNPTEFSSWASYWNNSGWSEPLFAECGNHASDLLQTMSYIFGQHGGKYDPAGRINEVFVKGSDAIEKEAHFLDFLYQLCYITKSNSDREPIYQAINDILHQDYSDPFAITIQTLVGMHARASSDTGAYANYSQGMHYVMKAYDAINALLGVSDANRIQTTEFRTSREGNLMSGYELSSYSMYRYALESDWADGRTTQPRQIFKEKAIGSWFGSGIPAVTYRRLVANKYNMGDINRYPFFDYQSSWSDSSGNTYQYRTDNSGEVVWLNNEDFNGNYQNDRLLYGVQVVVPQYEMYSAITNTPTPSVSASESPTPPPSESVPPTESTTPESQPPVQMTIGHLIANPDDKEVDISRDSEHLKESVEVYIEPDAGKDPVTHAVSDVERDKWIRIVEDAFNAPFFMNFELEGTLSKKCIEDAYGDPEAWINDTSGARQKWSSYILKVDPNDPSKYNWTLHTSKEEFRECIMSDKPIFWTMDIMEGYPIFPNEEPYKITNEYNSTLKVSAKFYNLDGSYYRPPIEAEPLNVTVMTDVASFIIPKNPETVKERYRWFSAEPKAYAELKNYGAGSNQNGTLDEDFEVMAGVPSTRQLYYAAGGTEFMVDVSFEYEEDETAIRSYTSYMKGIACQYKTADEAKSYTVPSYSGILCSGSDYSLQVHNGDLQVSVSISGSIGNDASPVTNTALHSVTATCPAQPNAGDLADRASAYSSLCDWVSNVEAFVISHTAASDKITRAPTIGEVCTTNLPGCPSNVPQTTTASNSVGCSYSPPDEDGNGGTPCGNEMATATASPDGPASWSVTATITIPQHCICGPCCDHMLPNIYDTWSQSFKYDSLRITDIHVNRIDQAAATDLSLVIGPAVDNNMAGQIEPDNETVTNIEGRSYTVTGQYKNPNNLPYGTVAAMIQTNAPNIFYNIAMRNSNMLKGNNHTQKSKSITFKTPDGIGKATEHSLVGRVRYSLDPTQHDEVFYDLGQRTNTCDGMCTTYPTNVEAAGGKGHDEDWGKGFLYNSFKGLPTVTGTAGVNGSQINQSEVTSNRGSNGLNFDANSYWRPTSDPHMTYVGQTKFPLDTPNYFEDHTDDQDKATPEYTKFLAKRKQTNGTTTITDFLILQTTSGNQSILYYEKKGDSVTAEEQLPEIDVTKEEMWDNNTNGTAVTWEAKNIEINVGGYNGDYVHPERKFNGTSNHNEFASCIYNNDPAKTIVRPAKPTRPLMIYSEPLNIITETANGRYLYSNMQSEVFWSTMLHWSDETASSIEYPTDVLDSNVVTGISQVSSDDGGTNFPFNNLEDLRTVWGQKESVANYEEYKNSINKSYGTTNKAGGKSAAYDENEAKSYSGYVKDTVYSDENMIELNGIVIHDPISTSPISLISLPDERDQRYSVKLSAEDTNNRLMDLMVCPGTVQECEFAQLDCKYGESQNLALFTFNDRTDKIINDVSKNEITIPTGYSISGGKLVGNYGDRIAIPFYELGITNSASNKIDVEFDINLSSLPKDYSGAGGTLKSRISQMLISFEGMGLYVSVDGKIGFITSDGQYRESTESINPGQDYNIKARFSFNNLDACTLRVNNNPVTFIKSYKDEKKIIEQEHIGINMYIGSMKSNTYGLRGTIDNISVIRVAGTYEHTDDCYIFTEVHPSGLNAHVHTKDCVASGHDTIKYWVTTYNGIKYMILMDQNLRNGGYFANKAEAQYNLTYGKYSLISKMENYAKKIGGKYQFILYYPDQNYMNIWKQTKNPLKDIEDPTLNATKTASGYEPVSIQDNTHYWGGLVKSSRMDTETLIDGSTNHSNWWHAIGTYVPFVNASGSGIPGGHSTNVQHVTLLVACTDEVYNSGTKVSLTPTSINNLPKLESGKGYDYYKAEFEAGRLTTEQLREIFGDAFDELFLDATAPINKTEFTNESDIVETYNCDLKAQSGELVQTILGRAPYFVMHMPLVAENNTKITITADNNTAGKKAKLYFSNVNGNWTEANSLEINMDPNTKGQKLEFILSGMPGWTGNINYYKLYIPAEDDKNYGGTVVIKGISTMSGKPETVNFGYTGAVQSYTAPATGYYNIEAWGANGGDGVNNNQTLSSHGGIGGYSSGIVRLNKGETIYVYVGGKGQASTGLGTGGGWNGGGHGSQHTNGAKGYGGGGMTHWSTVSTDSFSSTVKPYQVDKGHFELDPFGGSIIGSDDDGGDGLSSYMSIRLEANTTYLFSVGRYSSSRTGTYPWSISNPSGTVILSGTDYCDEGAWSNRTYDPDCVHEFTTTVAGYYSFRASANGGDPCTYVSSYSQKWVPNMVTEYRIEDNINFNTGAAIIVAGGGGGADDSQGNTPSGIVSSETAQTLNISNITELYCTDSSKNWANSGLITYGNGIRIGTEGSAGYNLVQSEVSIANASKLTFSYRQGQAGEGGDSGSWVSGYLEVGYGTAGDTSFTSIWKATPTSIYWPNNYTNETINLTSIPAGNVLKFKATKTGGSYRWLAHIINIKLYTKTTSGNNDGSGGFGGGINGGNAYINGIETTSSTAVYDLNNGMVLDKATGQGGTASTNAAGQRVFGPFVYHPAGDNITVTVQGTGLINGYPRIYTDHGGIQFDVGSGINIIEKTNTRVTYTFTVPSGLTTVKGYSPYEIWEFCYYASNSNPMTIVSTTVTSKPGAGLPATGGTQTSGYKQGLGQSATLITDTAGAGGGWWGGKATNNNNGGAGGGSGHINTSKTINSYKSTITGKTYTSSTSKTTTKPNTDGNGYARVTYLDVAASKFPTIEQVFEAYEKGKIPPESGIFNCTGEKNTHICDANCRTIKTLNCLEPHHNGNHYLHSELCYKPCNDDAKHKAMTPDKTSDGTFTPGNFINIDWPFEIYYANRGDFAQAPNMLGISSLTATRGMGYKDNMDTTEWTKIKRTIMPVNVTFDEYLYIAGEWIILADKGEYQGLPGAPYDERNWSNYDTRLYYNLYGDKFKENGTKDYRYHFYCVEANHEHDSAVVEVNTIAVNNRFNSTDDELEAGYPNYITNRTREGTDIKAKHSTYNKFYIDVVGRIGNLAIIDTGDYRFSNLFKKSTGTNGSIPDPTMYTVSGADIKEINSAIINGDKIEANSNGQGAILNKTKFTPGNYRIYINGDNLTSSAISIKTNISWVNMNDIAADAMIVNAYQVTGEDITEPIYDYEVTGPDIGLQPGTYNITINGIGLNSDESGVISGVGITNWEITDNGLDISDKISNKTIGNEAIKFTLTTTTPISSLSIHGTKIHTSSDFSVDQIIIKRLEDGMTKELVGTSNVSVVTSTSNCRVFNLKVPDEMNLDIAVLSAGLPINVESIGIQKIDVDNKAEYIVEGIVKDVDVSKQNTYLTNLHDIRGVLLENNGGYNINTYSTLPWAQDINSTARPTAPLDSTQNNISILRNEPMLVGYDTYLSIGTIGDYYRNGASLLQVIPEYYAIDIHTGKMQPVDAYINYNETYQPVNIWGLVTGEDKYTFGGEGSGYNINNIYDFVISLLWGEEYSRRMYTAAEEYMTNYLKELETSTTEDGRTIELYVPTSNKYIMGNSQFMQLTGKARTFVGGETTYGVLYNRSYNSTVSNTYLQDDKTGILYNNNGRISADYWWKMAQRWHLTMGLPSSTVFVKSGTTPTLEAIAEIKDGDYLIIGALDIRAIGEVWNLRYVAGDQSLNIAQSDGTIKTMGIPNEIEVNGVKHKIPPAIIVYQTKETPPDDITITSTH